MAQNHIGNVILTLLQPVRVHDVDVEEGVKRVLMGDVIGGQAGYRDIEVDRVDARPENSLRYAALQQIVQGVDNLLIHFTDELRAFDMFSTVKIFARQEFPVFGMFDPDRHQEMHELAHAGLGIHLARHEVALTFADGLVGGFQRSGEQAVLVADVVI